MAPRDRSRDLATALATAGGADTYVVPSIAASTPLHTEVVPAQEHVKQSARPRESGDPETALDSRLRGNERNGGRIPASGKPWTRIIDRFRRTLFRSMLRSCNALKIFYYDHISG